ncbi:retrovirus-related pol polyprotein from transposon TNT 1-94 [Tanacetum coccineum]
MAAVEVPQTLEYKGGQLNAAPLLKVENFTNWKKRFMCHIISIEPQCENIIKNGPFIPMVAGQRKPEGQWTTNERKAANLDQRYGLGLILYRTPCAIKGVLSLDVSKDFHDSPDYEEDTRSSHEYLNDLKEEYQARALLAKFKRFFKKDTQRFINAKTTGQTECHKYGKKGHFTRDCWPTKDFEAKYNKVKAKLTLLSLSASVSKASTVKNKGLITEAYEWDEEEVSSDDNEMVEVKVLMALAEENDVFSKEGARSGEWVEISMRKCISEQIPSQKKRILRVDQLTKDSSSSGQKDIVFIKSSADDTKVSIPAESQRNTIDPSVAVTDSSATDYDSADESSVCSAPIPPLKKLDGVEPISGPKSIKSILRLKFTFKAETLKGVIINEPSSALAKDNKSSSALKVNSTPVGKLKSVKIEDVAIINKEVNNLKLQFSKSQSSYSRSHQPLQVPHNTLQNKYKTQFKRSCDMYALNNHLSENCYKVLFCKKCEKTDHRTCNHAEYISTMNMSQHLKSPSRSSSRSKIPRPSKRLFLPCTHCEGIDHLSNECLYYPICELCKSYYHDTNGHNRIISLERESNPRNPQHAFKRWEACGSLTHPITDHYDIEWFKKSEALQAKKAEALKSTRVESSNANRSKTPTKSGCLRHMTGVKSYLHKYVEQPGPKVVFEDDSTCITEGYGSIKCNGIVFTKFDEKRGTIFNSNKEVVMIAPSGKHHRASFKTKQTSSIKKCLHLLHMDLFRHVTPRSIDHEKYTLVIVDEYSRCSVYIHNYKDHLGKFNEKADDGYLLGYSLVSKAFKVFNTRRQKTKETYHITFDESHDAIKFSRPSVDKINIAENERYPPDEYLHPNEPSQSGTGTVPNGIRIPVPGNQVFPVFFGEFPDLESVQFQYGSSSVSRSESKCSSLNNNDVSFIEPYESPEPVFLETEASSDQNGQTDQNDQTTQTDEILNDNLFEHSNHNIGEKNIDNLLNTKDIQIYEHSSSQNVEDTSVQDTISIPNPPLPIPSVVTPAPQDRWYQEKHIELVSIIGNPRAGMLTRAMAKQLNAASAHECLFVDFLSEEEPKKVRLIAQGYNQQEGVDYDETFALVVRLEAIRIFLAFATYMNFILYQMDFKSTFLNGKLKEEVYVKQPPGFESNEFPNHVCKLDKALYKLKQAPRSWYETISTFLTEHKFVRGKIDNTLFVYKTQTDVILVQIYVDDIIFGSTSTKLCKQFAKLMT